MSAHPLFHLPSGLHRAVRRQLRLARVLVLVAGLVAGALALAAPSSAATPAPRTPAGLPSAIEGMADYVPQVACDQRTWPGTRALATYLVNTYKSTTPTTWASTYACGTDGTPSEHSDGRAIDWMVSMTNARQKAAAFAAISWLLATDAQGNRFAMARRLGIMYLIYDNRMWGAWSGQWEDYNGCQAKSMQKAAYANSCHRTHIHISLSWNGAQGRTSFWTKKVATATDYGPCRPADLNWAPRYSRANYVGCQSYPSVRAAKGASSTKKALVKWSGAWLDPSSSGPAVTAVQNALHLSTSTRYGSRTAQAVAVFQRTHHLSGTGTMDQNTWRALLTAVA